MSLPPPGLALHTRLLELLDLGHALAVHLTVLPDQPAAQHAAEESYHQAHGGRDPHALAVEGAFGCWEDVCAWRENVSLCFCSAKNKKTKGEGS